MTLSDSAGVEQQQQSVMLAHTHTRVHTNTSAVKPGPGTRKASINEAFLGVVARHCRLALECHGQERCVNIARAFVQLSYLFNLSRL